MSALNIEGLTFGYDRSPVLHDVNLEVPSGHITAVIGPSGCGKTTLLRLLAGFERPRGGVIRFDGDVVAGTGTFLTPDRRNVGIVPQEGALFPHLNVADNIGYALAKRSPGRGQRIAQLLELIGLEGFEQRYPRQLSGGQQQRVALARALAPQPRVVLLDEPFASLDPATRLGVRGSVREVIEREKATALIVTHDRDEALSMADLVVVMLGGRIAQVGAPVEVYDTPASAEVARLLGEANLLPVLNREGAQVRTALGLLECSAGEGGHALVRPEQIALRAAGDGVEARVTACDFVGSSTRLTAQILSGEHTMSEIIATVVHQRPHTGDRVWLGVDQAVPLVD